MADKEGVKFPDVKVKLVGENGNAYAILGRVSRELKRAGHGDQVDAFMKEATDGDYNHLLQTCLAWVDVDPPIEFVDEKEDEEEADDWDEVDDELFQD